MVLADQSAQFARKAWRSTVNGWMDVLGSTTEIQTSFVGTELRGGGRGVQNVSIKCVVIGYPWVARRLLVIS